MGNKSMRHLCNFKNLVVFFLFTVLAGFQGNALAADFTLTINPNPVAGGSVSGAGSIDEAASVTITATPAAGWQFVNWTGDVTGVDVNNANPAAFTMGAGHRVISANFIQIPYTLTQSISPAPAALLGTVSVSPASPLYNDTAVTLTAPDLTVSGWQFVSWTGDVAGITDINDSTPTAFTMGVGNRTITANYIQIPYTLTQSISPAPAALLGTVSVSPASPLYNDTAVTLTAPDLTVSGWQFVSWTGDVAGITDINDSTPTAFTMGAGNRTITANYIQIPYTLTPSISPAPAALLGTVSVSPASPLYNDTAVTLTAPDLTASGWQFVNWTGDVAGITDINDSTPTAFTMGVGNRTITANYILIEYPLTINILGLGTVSKSPDTATYHLGDVVQLTATPAADSGFRRWELGLSGSTSPANYTIINGTNQVRAVFGHTITASTDSGGTITPIGAVGVDYQGSQAFSVTADSAHCIQDVEVDSTSVGALANYTFTNVMASHTIHSTFRTKYTVTGNIEPANSRYLARWRLRNADTNAVITGWYKHGQTVNVPCGVINVKIEYNTITCWDKPLGAAISPAAADTSIAANSNPTITGTYTIQQYDLVFGKSGTGDGTVLALPNPPGGSGVGTYTFDCGTTVNVIATQDTTSEFIQWNGDVIDPANHNTTISLYQDEVVSAVFNHVQYTLSLAVSGTGTVNPTAGNHLYDPETVVNLIATPGAGWTFQQWIGDVADMNSQTTTVTMSNDQTVTAVFKLSVNPNTDDDGDGYNESGTGTSPGVDCNDGNAAVHPGGIEICGDGIDQDCDGADTICNNDADGDGWDPGAGDCDDTDMTIYPGAAEVCGDGIIQDCNRTVDLVCAPGDQDADHDGYSPNLGDCVDTAPLIHPGTVDICGDGIDQDCYDGDRQCGIADTCVDISDEPLNAKIQAAPANVMFLLDDSGSMDWTMLVGTNGGGGGGDGTYKDYSYIMDNPGDNAYANTDVIGFSERRYWESQWSNFNNMYYNPQSYYFPWADNTHVWSPTTPETWPAMADANMDYPRSNPINATPTFDFTTTATNTTTPDYTTLWESGGQRIMVQHDATSVPINSYTLADAVKVVYEHSPVTTRITGSANDAEQFIPTHATNGGDTNINSGDLDMVCDGYEGGATGVRFVSIILPEDYSPTNPITEATIEFKASASDSGGANFTIAGEASDDSQAFATVDDNITDRTPTTGPVNWTLGNWTNDTKYSTPNLATIVNQIISRPGWQEGNAITFIIRGTGCRRADSVDASTADAPLLTLKTATTDATAKDIYVDNRDSLFQWEGIKNGVESWGHSSSNSAWNTWYYRTRVGELAADPVSTATWLLNIEKTGFHHVYTWNPEYNDSDQNAPYTIFYNGGIDSGVIRMDQRARAAGGNAGQWYELVKSSATSAAAGVGASSLSCNDLGSIPVAGATFRLGTETQIYTVSGGTTTSLSFSPVLASAKGAGTTIEFENWWYFNQDTVPRRSHNIHRAHYYTMSEVGKTTTTTTYTGTTSNIAVNSVAFAAGDVVVIDGVPQYYPLKSTTTATNLNFTRSIAFTATKPLPSGTEVTVLRPYLVMLDSHDINKVAEGSGSIQYYKVIDNNWDALVEVGEGNNMVDYGELSRESTPPPDIVPKKNFVKTTSAGAVNATSLSCESTTNPITIGDTFSVEGDPLTHTVTTGTTATSIVFTPGLGTSIPVGRKIVFNNPSVAFDRTFTDEKQNFANWFSFFSRRELSAKAAVGRVIADMADINIGLHSINNNLKVEVQEVKPKNYAKIPKPAWRAALCTAANNYCDRTTYLLTSLYNVNSNGGTPLQEGLQRVGDYFDCHNPSGGIMNGATEYLSPYRSEGDGGACQQSFAIVMTDGYYNGAAPNIDRDGNNATAFNADGNHDTAWDVGDYADTIGDTLGDISMHYFERDLSTTLPGQVPKSVTDQNPEQHMVTYSVAFGATGTLPPNPPGSCPPDCAWPIAASYSNLTNQQRIDDLFHAAVNGRGTFVTASDPQALVDALLAIKSDIELKVGSGAAVGITPSGQLSADTYIFQGTYDPANWSGDISAYQLFTLAEEIADKQLPVPVGIKAGNVKYPAAWKIDDTMRTIRIADPHWWGTDGSGTQGYIRQVISYNGTQGVPFLMPVDPLAPDVDELTIPQLGYLGASIPVQAEMISYLRGDVSNEQPNGLAWRARGGKMFGDFVHSAPIMVTTTVRTALAGDGKDNNNNLSTDEIGEEEPKLVIGSNDGGLHVLNPDDQGNELFTYIPGLVMDQLTNLSTPNPGFQHKFYVDNTVYAEKIGDNASAPTLAVGGLGKGGKGYFCLNLSEITKGTAEQKAGDIVKWEYPNANLSATDIDTGLPVPLADANGYMGYTFSQGYIVKSNKAGEWMVVFGNGYESPSGKAVLVILGLDASGNITWRKEINTGVGDPAVVNHQCNGLSSPALIDVDYNGTVDYAFAGDLLGNMWKFDLRDSNASNWEIAFEDNMAVKQPLFTASYALNRTALGWESTLQPITTQPEVILPCKTGQKGYLVIFGTGRYLKDDEYNDVSGQTLYGIWDWTEEWDELKLTDGTIKPEQKYLGSLNLPSEENAALNPPYIRAVSQQASQSVTRTPARGVSNGLALLEQVQITGAADAGQAVYRFLSNNKTNWYSPSTGEGEHVGWFFNLPGDGERMVSDVTVIDGILKVITVQPSDSPCSGGTVSISHGLDACDGGAPDETYFDINGDGKIDSDDLVNIGSATNPKYMAPAGFYSQGQMFNSANLNIGSTNTAVSISSVSNATLNVTRNRAEKRGVVDWREVE